MVRESQRIMYVDILSAKTEQDCTDICAKIKNIRKCINNKHGDKYLYDAVDYIYDMLLRLVKKSYDKCNEKRVEDLHLNCELILQLLRNVSHNITRSFFDTLNENDSMLFKLSSVEDLADKFKGLINRNFRCEVVAYGNTRYTFSRWNCDNIHEFPIVFMVSNSIYNYLMTIYNLIED